MANQGLYWFTDGPDTVAQKLSTALDRIDIYVGEAVSGPVDRAVELMRRTVLTGGVENGVPTGGPRIDTGAMFSSIDGKVNINLRGRVQAEYGYINDAPYWTLFQEYGTRSRHGGMDRKVQRRISDGPGGILPLHAFVDATEQLRRDLAVSISNVDIWRDFR